MNLATHIRVLWRFRTIAIAGFGLAVVLAVFAAYKVGPSGLERRGSETYSSGSSVLVTQKGCPECRTTLPSATAVPGADGEVEQQTEETKDGKVKFADPSRYSYLALLYAVLARSDLVISQLPSHPKPGQVKVAPVDATGSGNQFLPIIDTTALAATPAAAKKLNQEAVEGFRSLLRKMQDESNTPDESRVELTVLNAPSAGKLVSGRSMTPSVMAFLLCIIATVAAAHILEALRPRQPAAAPAPASFDELALIADDNGSPAPARLATVEADDARMRSEPDDDDDVAPPSWRERAHR